MNALLLSLFLAQANMGLTVPTPGVTPGPTYATQISNDLVIIDAHNHTPGNGVQVPTAGLNINALLPFNGFGATGFNSCTGTACGITNPYTGTFVTLGSDVGDGGYYNVLQGGTGFLNTITLNGKATGTDPTITVAGDATRSLNIIVPAATTGALAGLGISPSLGGNAFIGANQLAGGGASLWLGNSASTATSANYTLFSSGASTELSASTTVVLGIANVSQVQLTTAALSLLANIPIQQSTAATALKLIGNAAGTGGIGTVLDNNVNQTTGTITSFQTQHVEKASVDFAGGYFSGSGKFSTATPTTGLTLTGNSAGVGLIVNNTVDLGGTGTIASFQSAGTPYFAISGRGHLIPQGNAPTAPVTTDFNTGYRATAAVTAISINGSDASFQLKFTVAGVPTAITAGAVLVPITLGQAYSSTAVTGMACYGKAGNGPSDTIPLAVVQNAVGTIQIIAAAAFTPVIGAYVFNVQTMGAGAAY